DRSASPEVPAWIALALKNPKSKGTATFTPQDDGSLLVGGTNADFDTYTFTATADVEEITAVRLEVLADPSLAKGGPGRAQDGGFILTDFRLTARPKQDGAKPAAVALTNPRATYEQEGLPVAAAIDDDKKSGWAVGPRLGEDHAAVFETEGTGIAPGTLLTF